MARAQQIFVNACFVLLGFVVSGKFKHLWMDTTIMTTKNNSNNINDHFAKQRETTAVEGSATTTNTNNRKASNNNNNNNHDSNSKVQFVFFMGLEGVGHEFVSSIAHASPLESSLSDLNVFPMDINKMQAFLLDHDTGLWSAYFNPTPAESLDLTGTQSRLVRTLSRIQNKLLTKGNENDDGSNNKKYYIPVNIMSSSDTPYGDYGRVRYLQPPTDENGDSVDPKFKTPVRMIAYPSIDILYDACEEAGVECRHVYLYRNLYELLHKSTATHILEAMHTSISMLLVIASQMRMHPHRTLGCWNLSARRHQEDHYTLDTNQSLQIVDGSITMQELFGYATQQDLQQVVSEKYVPFNNKMTWSQLKSIVPDMNQNYFDSLQKSHETILSICQEHLS